MHKRKRKEFDFSELPNSLQWICRNATTERRTHIMEFVGELPEDMHKEVLAFMRKHGVNIHEEILAYEIDEGMRERIEEVHAEKETLEIVMFKAGRARELCIEFDRESREIRASFI